MPVFVNNLQEKVKTVSMLTETINLVVTAALKVENRVDDPEVSVALVDDSYIKELNYKYRHKDKPTDVLSFPMDPPPEEELPVVDDENNLLGDIIISLETAERQAQEYGHSLLREVAYLTAHGMFHLLGYTHDGTEDRRVMREKEEKVLSLLNINR